MSRTQKADGGIEVGLGGLFKGIGSLFELVSKMAEEGKDECSGTGEKVAADGKGRVVYGFSVRMGLGGRPVVEQFGNVKATEEGAEATEVREPLTDVLDEGDHITVIVELPGVVTKDIHINVKDDILEIVAETKGRKYCKEVLLPAHVDDSSLKSSCRNGILEITLGKRKRAGAAKRGAK